MLRSIFDRSWRHLGRILEGFEPHVEGQVGQKMNHMASCWQDGQETQNLKQLFVFCMILGHSACQLGGQDGSKIDPRSIQNQEKIDKKRHQKYDTIFD